MIRIQGWVRLHKGFQSDVVLPGDEIEGVSLFDGIFPFFLITEYRGSWNRNCGDAGNADAGSDLQIVWIQSRICIHDGFHGHVIPLGK